MALSAIASVVDRAGAGLAAGDRALLDRLVVHLPQRFAAVEACGLPATLVHGDFHPGNFRGASRSLVLLDFADSIVGHPLLDMPAFLTRVPRPDVPAAREKWFAAWRAAIPSCDPERAAALLAPIAAARQAAIYQAFLDAIEPSEHPYHQGDPRAWLDQTVDILRSDRRRHLSATVHACTVPRPHAIRSSGLPLDHQLLDHWITESSAPR